MPYTLTVKTKRRGDISITWNNVDQLSIYSNLQSGFYLQENQTFSKDLLFKHFEHWNQMFWTQREDQGMLDYPDGANILDIGAGMAVIDLLLYNYIPNSKFYLLDKEDWDESFAEFGTPKICYGKTYPFYNSWRPVKDAIESSQFDQSRFKFISQYQEIPENLDVVTSYLSWCFHYPKETYWDKVFNSLKTGGKLILDVRPLHDKDILGEISEQMKSSPVTFAFPKVPSYVDEFDGPEKNITGYRCMWIKNV